MRAPLAALLLASCTALVTPPPRGADDVEVLLVDEAWHKGLVLATDDGTLVEWGFGDWAWYAQGRSAWYDVFATVFWPSSGTLSRREWDPGERASREPESVVVLHVARERATRLHARLSAEFERARATLVHNDAWRTDFVRHESSYWLFHDCHDATAAWLEALGCRVEPGLVRAGLALRDANAAERTRDD